jgi:ketosteroid isomerase-like protein
VSEENVEIVRRAWEHFVANREALDELYAPAYVLDISTLRDWIGQRQYEGVAGTRAFVQDWTEGLDEWRIEIIAYRDAGDRVVLLGHQSGRSASSGVPVELNFGNVLTVKNGLITREELYADPAEALKAVGLEESAVSANLDLVRSIRAAWERGDYGSTEWAHPEIEFAVVDGPSPGTWKGLAGMAKGMREALSAWRMGFRSQADEYRELDDERVLVLIEFRGRGKASGLDVEQLGTKGADVFHLRDGKVMRLVLYWDRDRAFADLGLEG